MADEPPETAAQRSAARAWVLTHREGKLVLRPSGCVIGRSQTADLYIDDPQASRKHARLDLDARGPTIQDLGSANGVFVNGARIRKPVLLHEEDKLLIGKTELVVSSVSMPGIDVPKDVGFRNTQTLRDMAARPGMDEPTRRAHALALFGGVARKALALGKTDQAEQVLDVHLHKLLEFGRVDGTLPEPVAATANDLALELAFATKKGEWIDYVFELNTITSNTLGTDVVDRLYELVRESSTVNLETLRSYISTLKGVGSLGPAERFALRRLEGLERIVAAL